MFDEAAPSGCAWVPVCGKSSEFPESWTDVRFLVGGCAASPLMAAPFVTSCGNGADLAQPRLGAYS